MKLQRLDPKAKSMWRLSRALGLLIVAGICAGAWFLIFSRLTDISLTLRLLIVVVPVLLQLLNLLIYPTIEFLQWAYLITPDRIEIHKGIFFHSIDIIPISRIQHVTKSEGPVARLFKLATLSIHTAGGSFKIVGLRRETAQSVADSLKDVVNRKLTESKE
jgi:membrane protein YdbS with pleckstrin-like domain